MTNLIFNIHDAIDARRADAKRGDCAHADGKIKHRVI